MREEERDEGEDALASKLADMRATASDYLARRIPNDVITQTRACSRRHEL